MFGLNNLGGYLNPLLLNGEVTLYVLQKTLKQAYSISKKFIKKGEHLQNTLGKAYLNRFLQTGW